MARWKPDARARLEKAALALYREHGFAQTTVAEIAERAGLTERTFFRYFADKREVLFSGAEVMQQRLVGALDDAPRSLAPIDAVGSAISRANARRSFLKTRNCKSASASNWHRWRRRSPRGCGDAVSAIRQQASPPS